MGKKYKRILLKLSGEALAGANGQGLDDGVLSRLADVMERLVDAGKEIAIVVGGGNFWRGRMNAAMDRTTADHMGMLATTINALALSDSFERRGLATRVMNAVNMSQICEPYIRKRAIRHLEKGRIIILAGGTGNPYFTTDSAAALRASEIDAEVIFKATMVDGVYNKDPKIHADAVRFNEVALHDVLNDRLGVMDSTAAALCRDNKMPIVVFSVEDPMNILRIAEGEGIGTLVY
ncbi:MAG TPA: UMP kinase [Clostridiaceae bacterium]|nr:UMP kinase [Clostridiaceae bacterium]